MSYSGVCYLSSFSKCAVVISVIYLLLSSAGFDILFLFMLIFFLNIKKGKHVNIYYSPKGFWRGHSAIKTFAKEAKISEKQAL